MLASHVDLVVPKRERRRPGNDNPDRLQETLLRDVDTWLTAEEAVEYGIADVVEGRAMRAEVEA